MESGILVYGCIFDHHDRSGRFTGTLQSTVISILYQCNGDGMGGTMADIVSMLINCTISFWVFFPIMKFIFRK